MRVDRSTHPKSEDPQEKDLPSYSSVVCYRRVRSIPSADQHNLQCGTSNRATIWLPHKASRINLSV